MRKNVRSLVFIIGFSLAFSLFVACGDDSSSGPEEESSSSIEVEEVSSSSGEKKPSSIATNSSSSCNDITESSSSVIMSSAEVTQSSSSEDASSSSQAIIPEKVMEWGYYDCEKYTCVDTTYLSKAKRIEGAYGEILDTRDNKVYKVITIGEGANSQTWMAQNLNYAYDVETAKSYCYGKSADSCAKYGRLYLWSAAMDSAGIFSTDGEGCGYGETCSVKDPVRGVCPAGWHLPSRGEWEILFASVGGPDAAGTELKAVLEWSSQTGDLADGNAYGFSTLHAGFRNYDEYFSNAGSHAYFWSASLHENDNRYAYNVSMNINREGSGIYNGNKQLAFSVRCLQD